jgi:hypothetical protein
MFLDEVAPGPGVKPQFYRGSRPSRNALGELTGMMDIFQKDATAGTIEYMSASPKDAASFMGGTALPSTYGWHPNDDPDPTGINWNPGTYDGTGHN